MTKHYLITGGCGFIGSALAHKLIIQGHHVTIIDDLSGSLPSACPPGATLMDYSILNVSKLRSTFDDEWDGCFHLAALISPKASLVIAHDVNIIGTQHVFHDAGVFKLPVVYASSAAVYGAREHGDKPLQESDLTALTQHKLDNVSLYGWHKRYSELIASCYNISAIGIRLFNVYGPLQAALDTANLDVTSNFILNSIAEQPLIIMGTGEQVRDFIHIDDAVEIMIRAMNRLHEEKGYHRDIRPHYVVNGCTGKGTSINQVAKIIAKAKHLEILHEGKNQEVTWSVGDPSYLKELLGVTPAPLTDESIRELLCHC